MIDTTVCWLSWPQELILRLQGGGYFLNGEMCDVRGVMLWDYTTRLSFCDSVFFFLSFPFLCSLLCTHTHTHRKLNKPARTQQQQQQQAGGWMCLLNVRRLSAADGMHSSKKHFQRRCRLYLRTQRVAKWKGCVDFFFLLFSPCFAGLNGRETIPTWIKWEAWWRWEGQSTPEMEEHLCVCVGCKKKKKKYEDESSRCIGLAIWLACGEMPTKT